MQTVLGESADAALPALPVPPPAPPLALDPKPPPLPGKVTKLVVKSSATVGGVTVKFAFNSHKRPAKGGRSLGMWGFELARAGKKHDFELRDSNDHFEAEIDALGVALVFRHLDYDSFEIIVAAAKTPKALDDDACVALIEKEAAHRTLPDSVTSHDNEHGIVNARAPTWIGHCGTLTKRIWFTAPPVQDP